MPMSVLIIANIVVEDPANLAAYQEAAIASIKGFGIRLIGRVNPTTMLEGEFAGGTTVVLEAESELQAKAWYSSDGYTKGNSLIDRLPHNTPELMQAQADVEVNTAARQLGRAKQ